MSWHEICVCKCRVDTSVCNDRQCWNSDKCQCVCKELINKGRCDDGFVYLNPSAFECKCDKSWDVDKYLDCEA